MNILFICTGNTCRSPMAEAILRNKNLKNVYVKSAGIFAVDGNKANHQTVKVLKENSISHQHSSKLLTEVDVKWATYIFAMTSNHKGLIVENYPVAADKTFTLKEFVNEGMGSTDVVDPYGGTVEIYRETYGELTTLIEALIKKME